MPTHGIPLNAWGKAWGTAWGNSWGANVTPNPQDGRSGYWRLFFYQLQEAELLKGEKAQTPAPKVKLEPVKELKDGSALVGTPAFKPREITPEPEPEPEPEPFLFKPTPLRADSPVYVVETMRIQMELSRLFTTWKIQAIMRHPRDDEDEELILLLAA